MAIASVTADSELEALLGLSLEGIEIIGTGDPAFPSPPPSSTVPPTPRRGLGGGATPNPAEPFSVSLGRMADRNPVYKASLLKDHQSAVDQVREATDLICLGEMESLTPLRAVTASLQEMFRRDPPAALSLSLARLSIPGDYQYRHAVNVSLLTMAAATAAGSSKSGTLEAGTAALAADVGMRLVPEQILEKSGKLTEPELAEIHKHPEFSAGLLGALEGVSPIALQVARQHHERLTGGGYPGRLTAVQIVPEARMVGIADTLAAMVHKRSHRDALTPRAALERVVKMAQMNFLDLEILKGLIGFLSLFPVGSAVDLGGGRIGRVVEAHPDDPARPTVAVLREAAGPLPLKSVVRIDLRKARDIAILVCLDPEALGWKPLDGF